MVKSEEHQGYEIKSKFLLNPFLWFSLVWVFVLILHSFNFSRVYPKTSESMYGFIITIVVISIILAVLFHLFFLKKLKNISINEKPLWIPIIIAYVILIFETIYSKQLPLISALTHSITYKDFGVPIVSGFMYSFSIFLSLMCSVKLIYGKKYKWLNFLALLLSYGRFVLVYSRGGLVMCVLATIIIFFSRQKFSWWTIPALLVLAVIGLYLFNILGNIRMGFAWNDSSYLLKISEFDKKYYALKDFSWGIVYIDSPFGNLLYNEAQVKPLDDSTGLFAMMLTSVITERLYPAYDHAVKLAIPNLTTATMFSASYKYMGYTGMIAVYIEMVAIVFISCLLCKKSQYALIACSSMLTILCSLSFFDNMFYTSGNSFALIYLVLFTIFFYKRTNTNSSQNLEMERA